MRYQRAAFVTLFLLLSSRGAIAQESASQASLNLPTAIFASAAAADWATTYHGVSSGKFAEGNPTIRQWQDHPAGMVAAGAAMDVGSVLLWRRLVGRRHRKIAAAGLYAVATFRMYLTAKGVSLIASQPSSGTSR